MRVRQANHQDKERLLPLAKALATSFEVRDRDFGMMFNYALDMPSTYLLVAEQDDELVGYLLGFHHPAFYANGLIALVEELYVSPEQRGCGVGKALMCAFENEAKANGCKLISLSTRRAGKFYQALGYEQSATYYKKTLEIIA